MRHVSRPQFGRLLPAHVTIRVCRDVPSLRTVPIAREIERTFSRGCERKEFRLVHYSLQGNHAHFIVEARDQLALGRGMMAIGARLARAVNRIVKRSGAVVAERYHHRVLRSPTEVRNALRYVLLNARRHSASAKKRLSRLVQLDRASSAPWFEGWRPSTLCEPVDSRGPSPVARARTWLLDKGWRKLGLLDPADVPASTP
jgi:REP element-mobilizing transposase RayT